MDLSAPIIGIGVFLIGSGLFGTVVSLELEAWGLSGPLTGAILSAYFVGVVLGALTASRAVQRAGHIRSFAALTAIFIVAVLLHPLLRHPFAWGGLRLVAGFCLAGIFVVCESWLNEECGPENRGSVLSAYMIASQLGLGGGQLLVGVYPVGQLEPFVLAAVALAAAVVPVTLTKAPGPATKLRPRLPLTTLFRRAPLGVVGCFVAGLLVAQLLSVTPLWGAQVGLAEKASGWLVGCLVVGGLLLQTPVGRLSDRVGRRPMLLAVGVSLAMLAPLSLPIEEWGWPLATLALLRGALTFLLYPLAVASANDHIDPDEVVGASGSLVLAWGAGAALGPVAATSAMSALGPAGQMITVGAVAGLFSLYVAYRIVRTRPVATEDRIDFVPLPMPHTTPGVTPFGAPGADHVPPPPPSSSGSAAYPERHLGGDGLARSADRHIDVGSPTT